MRGVAGVVPRNIRLATWALAVVCAAFCVAAAFYVASYIVFSPSRPALSPGVTTATESNQIPNREKKAARETVKTEVRSAPEIATPRPEIIAPLPEARPRPEIAAPKPEILTPLPEAGGDQAGSAETGQASWYDLTSKTASGEPMDPEALTAAHPSLPLGTTVRVANLDNGRAVVVRINDRGPLAKDRIIDLSKAAAEQLDMVEAGVARVSVTLIAGVVASNDKTGGETSIR